MSVPLLSRSALEAIPAEGWRGCPLFSLDNLYCAWRRCRHGKRRTHNALAFEVDLEANLLALRDELHSGTYQPRPSLAFLIERPKRREVFAADFRDRVVHHVLVGHLEPGWERRFIHDSYACRVNKGTHAAVERLRQFCRQVTANGTRPAGYLQLDVKGFFVTLDRRVLWARLAAHEHDPAVRWLIQVILNHEPAQNCRLRGHPQAIFTALPAHKTLFKAQPGCGLPIGNLTSQFFANVYLDALDQFIKHELKARHYLRYCDDLMLLHPDPAVLALWEQRIAAFLDERLGLTLNQRRRLRPVSNGIDFLGYIVRPDYLLVRRRVVGALRERLNQAEQALSAMACEIPPSPPLLKGGGEAGGIFCHGQRGHRRALYPWPPALLDRLDRQLQSYWAHLALAHAHRLRESIWRRYPWLHEYFICRAERPVRRVPARILSIRYREQIARFRAALPEYRLIVQRGHHWDVVPPLRPDGAEQHPRAWIVETGDRIGPLRERRVAWIEGLNDLSNHPGVVRHPLFADSLPPLKKGGRGDFAPSCPSSKRKSSQPLFQRGELIPDSGDSP